jgi:Tfp pilus assembly protein PilF
VRNLRRRLALAIAAFAALAPGIGSAAQIIGETNAGAAACSRDAKAASDGKMTPAQAVETCSEAILGEPLNPRDLAATYNNRGVLYLQMGVLPNASRDFDDAARVRPELAEAHVNRGAALVQMGHDAEALAELDKALAFPGLEEPWKAYYDRGVARENLKDLEGAYADYRKAAELKPDWDAPKAQLARFRVKTRP